MSTSCVSIELFGKKLAKTRAKGPCDTIRLGETITYFVVII